MAPAKNHRKNALAVKATLMSIPDASSMNHILSIITRTHLKQWRWEHKPFLIGFGPCVSDLDEH